MPPRFRSSALEAASFAAFALALCLSSCSRTQQTDSQQTPAQSSSPTPTADQQVARSAADSRWLIRVRGDARTVAFTEDGVLKRVLPRMPRLSELSPDGSRLLEVRFANGASDIFVADDDGSHARRIVRGVNPEDEAHWSRDGTRILYAASDGEGYKIFEVNERGNVLSELKSRDGDEVVSGPRYMPTGHISCIFRPVDTDPRHAPSKIVITNGMAFRAVVADRLISTYAWDSTGQRLAFGTYEDGGLIVTRELYGGAERAVKLVEIDKRLEGFVAHDIRWRPDGGAVAFRLSFGGGREKGAKALFGEEQLFVLYPDGHATWFDVEPRSSFDWLPVEDLPE